MNETGELYKHFSHFNFSPEQWLEAAARYLELEEAIAYREGLDGEIDHDADSFTRCDICEELQELINFRDEFAVEFAAIWAKTLVGR